MQTLDWIFIDADKINYPAYYELGLPLLKTGGVMVFDNVFWHGKVLDKTDKSAATQAIIETNQRLFSDPRVAITTLPLGDGMTLARKI